MFEYRCKVTNVVDGDTVDVNIDLGFGVWLYDERVRLYGIDTPESRTRDLEEKKYGNLAKKFVQKYCDDEWMVLKTNKYDSKGKFGRIMGELFRTTNYSDKSINELLVEKYMAVPYYGQAKSDIEEQHIINRSRVDISLMES